MNPPKNKSSQGPNYPRKLQCEYPPNLGDHERVVAEGRLAALEARRLGGGAVGEQFLSTPFRPNDQKRKGSRKYQITQITSTEILPQSLSSYRVEFF